MASNVEFSLLGPLVVRCDGVAVPVPPGKQRAVLAALLLNAGQLVSVDELTWLLWGWAPPPTAQVTVRNYVKRLRHALGAAERDRIRTMPHGYLITATADELDLTRFAALVQSAQVAVRDSAWERAAAQARAALALWRGEPLADVEAETLTARELPRLEELRLQAVEARIDADSHLGQHAEVVAELRKLVIAQPLRERLHGLLMLALYRDGRQGEALACYTDARRVLVEELGAEPGAALRDLHQRILAADPALEPGGAAQADGRKPAVPRELPAPVPDFVGRSAELAALTRPFGRPDAGATGNLACSVISGPGGVGKTAIALHWAHQLADRFPDGQLYVNLRGYDPGRPLTAADALAGFLRTLGVPGPDVPPDADERAARYRSLLAGRRVLVVLDNAGSAAQVRPLLPGTATCMALVTSRDTLAGLVARDGARRLDLEVLPLADAVRLLAALIGARVAADPGAAAELAAQCSCLPLALRVAAEFAALRAGLPLADLVAELADHRRRLDLLDAGDDTHASVRAVLSWSYRHLDTAAAHTFRLLGLHPGPDHDLYAVGALTGTTVRQAGQVLAQLTRAHLVRPAAADRHGMHDLLRAYARERADAEDSAAEQRAALSRLFDYYLATAKIATGLLGPLDRGRPPGTCPPADGPRLADRAAARAWLDAERATLVAATASMAANGWPDHAIRLAGTLRRYLDAAGHIPEATIIHGQARDAARDIGDRAAEASALNSLGIIDWRQGRYAQAAERLEQAIALLGDTGDPAARARALNDLGIIRAQQGLYPQAINYFHNSSALSRGIGNQVSEVRAELNLGNIDLQQGRYEAAAVRLQRVLVLCNEIEDQLTGTYALAILGCAYRLRGDYQRAGDHLRRAISLFRDADNRAGQAHALTSLGDLDLCQRRYEQAAANHREALSLCRETGDKTDEAAALNGLGETFLATGRPGDARRQHAEALALAAQTGEKYEQARAHNGLGHAQHAGGDMAAAREHWQQALVLYTALGAPEAERISAQLEPLNR